MLDTEEPPISRSVVRALAQLEALRSELADAAECASAAVRDEFRDLAPRLEHLDRFEDASEEHCVELRELLTAATDLRERLRRC